MSNSRIDINKKKINQASKKIRHLLHIGDITSNKINLKDKFDWIFLEEVLEHLDKDTQALKNIKKLLNKGGHLILTTPKKILGFDYWDPAWVGWKVLGRERHYHYSKKELEQKLSKAGFNIKETYTRGSTKWIFFRWINAILQYGFKSKKRFKNKLDKGYIDWAILAKKK